MGVNFIQLCRVTFNLIQMFIPLGTMFRINHFPTNRGTEEVIVGLNRTRI